jgi:hypothetical protein
LGVETFMLVLVGGAAVLALWILARYTGFGPRSLFWAVGHVVAACVLLQLAVPVALYVVDETGIPGARFVDVFGVALPLLVYAFLSGGWATRAALGLLRP